MCCYAYVKTRLGDARMVAGVNFLHYRKTPSAAIPKHRIQGGDDFLSNHDNRGNRFSGPAGSDRPLLAGIAGGWGESCRGASRDVPPSGPVFADCNPRSAVPGSSKTYFTDIVYSKNSWRSEVPPIFSSPATLGARAVRS